MGVKRFIDCHIPITFCNLRCSYCYIAQQEKFYNAPPKVYHSIEQERRAFSQDRLGGTCLINLCGGGETLLYPEIVELVETILQQGHFVMIVTNGLLQPKIRELVSLPKILRERLFFKLSFHYLELKRLDLFERFFESVRMIKDAGVSFTVELTPCDEEIEFIDDIKKKCLENLGALCHVTIGRSDIDPENRVPHLSKLSFNDYVSLWSSFESPLFEEKVKLFYHKRKEFCYAGDWSAFVDLKTGDIVPCNCGNRIGNFYDFSKPISFSAIGKGCTLPHCYNGHVWLSLGTIPELDVKTYAELRNRKCIDGTEWLNPVMKEAFSSKLCETNRKYGIVKKATNLIRFKVRNLYRHIRSIL